MKKLVINPIFFTMQLLFILLYIYKETLFIQESYIKQRYEKTKKELEQEKQRLSQELYALQDYKYIEQYARTRLQMHPIKIGAIKTMPQL